MGYSLKSAHTYIHTYIGSVPLPFFGVKKNIKDFLKGVLCPFFHGRDAPFCFLRQFKN